MGRQVGTGVNVVVCQIAKLYTAASWQPADNVSGPVNQWLIGWAPVTNIGVLLGSYDKHGALKTSAGLES